jgi:hypothetical protein
VLKTKPGIAHFYFRRGLSNAFVVALSSLLMDGTAFAQTPTAAPVGEDEDELEVPAAPPPVAPDAANPAARPSNPEPAKPVNAAPTANHDTDRIAELERRLTALESKGVVVAPPRKVEPDAGPSPEDALTPSAFDVPVVRDFRISGYAQADYLHTQASEDQLDASGAPLNENRFYLRRGRFRVDRGWEFAALTFELEANTVRQPIVGIRRAEASLFYQGDNPRNLQPLVMLTAGLTDLPFGYELYEPDRAAPFVERSLISSSFFPTKFDAGVKLSGAWSFLRYGVALGNGEPVDPRGLPRDPNGAKDVTGRLGVVAPVGTSFEITGGASFATGQGFHPGVPAKKSTVFWRDDNDDGVATPDEFQGVLGDAAQPSNDFDRWAFGLDLGARVLTRLGESHLWGELIAGSNYDRGYLIASPARGQNDVREFGGYVAFTQDVTRYGYVGVRLSVYDPNSDLLEQRSGKIEPKTQTIRTLSPVVALRLPQRARLLFQYDFIHDYMGRDRTGVPTDVKNDQWTLRLQVDL